MKPTQHRVNGQPVHRDDIGIYHVHINNAHYKVMQDGNHWIVNRHEGGMAIRIDQGATLRDALSRLAQHTFTMDSPPTKESRMEKQAILGDTAHARLQRLWRAHRGPHLHVPLSHDGNTSHWHDEDGNHHILYGDTNVVSYSPDGRYVTYRAGEMPNALVAKRMNNWGPEHHSVSLAPFAYEHEAEASGGPRVFVRHGNQLSTHRFEETGTGKQVTIDTYRNKAIPGMEVPTATPMASPAQIKEQIETAQLDPLDPRHDYVAFLRRRQAGVRIEHRAAPHEKKDDPETTEDLMGLAEEHARRRGHHLRHWKPIHHGNMAICWHCAAPVVCHHSVAGGIIGGSGLSTPCPAVSPPQSDPAAGNDPVATTTQAVLRANPQLPPLEARRLAQRVLALQIEADAEYRPFADMSDVTPYDFGNWQRAEGTGPYPGSAIHRGIDKVKNWSPPDASAQVTPPAPGGPPPDDHPVTRGIRNAYYLSRVVKTLRGLGTAAEAGAAL